MRKLIASTFVSLDGIMQAPGGPEEDPAGGFVLAAGCSHREGESSDLTTTFRISDSFKATPLRPLLAFKRRAYPGQPTGDTGSCSGLSSLQRY